MKRDVESGGYGRPWLFRPLGVGFWPDVKGALGFLTGAALAALLLDNLDLFVGSVVGVTVAVSASAVARRVKRRGERG
jgi:hypothetical protein